MVAAIPLRDDFDSAELRRLAQRSRDGAQTRRLLALAVIYDGHRRSDAARFAGVGLQRNSEGPEGLKDRKAPGPPYKLSEERRRGALASLRPGGIGTGSALAVTTVGQELRRMGYAKLSARPRHYARGFPERLKEIRAGLGDGVEVEIWWQDEARVGQKNKIARRWAKRGTRPSAPKDQRTTSAYIFRHLAEIARIVEPGMPSFALRTRPTRSRTSGSSWRQLALQPRLPKLWLDHCCESSRSQTAIGNRKWPMGSP